MQLANQIYVNEEHLSPDNKLLKAKCREIGYKYVWVRDGKFYVRKTDGEKVIKIAGPTDIDS